ncbi:unnamed protein product [Durusdinium trenchii]|uniref:HMG box domain-containing protein n=1 Tax=Durusdinium trenchii TaxID=1381693 RepID=A0ABP0SUV5_9DINO
MGHDPTKKQVLVPIVRGTLRLQVACFWLSYCCWKVLAPPRRERTATAEPCPAAGLGSPHTAPWSSSAPLCCSLCRGLRGLLAALAGEAWAIVSGKMSQLMLRRGQVRISRMTKAKTTRLGPTIRAWEAANNALKTLRRGGKLHGAAAAALPAAAPLRASWPVLSTQLLNFEPEKGKTKQTAIRGAQMQSSSSAPSLRTESSQGSLHAQTHTHGPSSSKRGSAAARVVRRPKERRYEAELFHVVARPLMDLQRMKAVDRERRSVVRPSRSPPPVSRRTSQASQAPRAEVAPLSRSTDKRVTVNIGRLSRVLAKQWTEVTSQEVETRRAKMERLSRSQGAEEVALDSFFEWHGEQPEDSVQLSSQASKTLESRMFSRAQNPALNASKGATPDWQEAQAGLVQKHLQQYRRWRTEGRPPSGRPVPLPVLVPKESLSKGANEAQQEVPAQATAHGSKGPSNAKPDSASKMDQYLKGFKDQDLNCLLEEISQTDTFPEGDEFVWPPKREVALPPIAAKGEAFIKALVRGDSPDPQLTRVENLKRSGYERSRSLPTGRRSPAL